MKYYGENIQDLLPNRKQHKTKVASPVVNVEPTLKDKTGQN